MIKLKKTLRSVADPELRVRGGGGGSNKKLLKDAKYSLLSNGTIFCQKEHTNSTWRLHSLEYVSTLLLDSVNMSQTFNYLWLDQCKYWDKSWALFQFM